MKPAYRHYSIERRDREKLIERIGEGNVIARFHVGSREIREVTDNSIIIVKSLSGRVITKLIARPAQISRLYAGAGMKAPAYLLKRANIHKARGWNNL